MCRLYTLNSAPILSDQHLLCGADKRLHRHLGNAFLAKYYNVYVVDINIATRYNVRMLKKIGLSIKTQALNGEWKTTKCRCLHELLGTAIKSFLMRYMNEL